METWIGCSKIYDYKTSRLHEDTPLMAKELFEKFVERIGHSPEYNVWYDTLAPRVFGADETYDNSIVSNEASFLTNKEDFLFHSKWGLPGPGVGHHLQYGFSTNYLGLVKHRDSFYEDLPDLQKFRDSKILILGGGPSTNLANWENLEYDYTWSCNDFYKNSKILKEKLELTYLNSETSMDVPEFAKYIKQNDTICVADTSILRSPKLLGSFKPHNIKTVSFNQRIFLSSGSMPKLIFFASVLGARKVFFAGMDGWTKKEIESMTTDDHAYNPGKKLKISKNYTFDFQRRETVVYWDYMLNFISHKVDYQNLGENYEHCMSAEISKKMFPLSERTRNE